MYLCLSSTFRIVALDNNHRGGVKACRDFCLLLSGTKLRRGPLRDLRNRANKVTLVAVRMTVKKLFFSTKLGCRSRLYPLLACKYCFGKAKAKGAALTLFTLKYNCASLRHNDLFGHK